MKAWNSSDRRSALNAARNPPAASSISQMRPLRVPIVEESRTAARNGPYQDVLRAHIADDDFGARCHTLLREIYLRRGTPLGPQHTAALASAPRSRNLWL